MGYGLFDACLQLTEITFTGTMAAWNAIAHDEALTSGFYTASFIIHCTDGDITV